MLFTETEVVFFVRNPVRMSLAVAANNFSMQAFLRDGGVRLPRPDLHFYILFSCRESYNRFLIMF